MAQTFLVFICRAVVVLIPLSLPANVCAQCQLANPSFELGGEGGDIFGGWNQDGAVSASSEMAPHGDTSAILVGNNTGDWNVSAVWQRLDTSPGERWSASVRAGHRSTNPLTGNARAILNVEWRDAIGDLIDFESFTVADAATPTDIMHRTAIESSPAPAGAVATHLLLGMLQSPVNEPGAAFFDLAEFDSLSSPTRDEQQWFDFPGGRVISFGGLLWRVKGPGFYGPGSSLFADSASHVWVDGNGRLHMTIREVGGSWYSTEITTEEPLGYGDYIFTTRGRLDTWAPNVVLGLFTWQYPACYDPANPWNLHNEFDIEISRWGVPGSDIGQFVAQPYYFPGNIDRFGITFTGDDELTSHAFRWLPDRIEGRIWRGVPAAEAPSTLIHTWTYTGPHLPRPEQPRVHVNFWQLNGPPSNSADHEVVIQEFRFVPACADELDESVHPCFVACLTGPEGAMLSSCGDFDLHPDNVIDLRDFSVFQNDPTGGSP